MIIRECEFCKKEIRTELTLKRFCNKICQRKHYIRIPEVNITPLHTFNPTSHEEVKKAFAPSNLQWLTKEENRKESGRLMMENNKSEESD